MFAVAPAAVAATDATMAVGERGSAYLWLMGVLVVLGLIMGRAIEVASTQADRQRERTLLQVGDAYRRAIASYAALPGSDGSLPRSVEDLLQDPRASEPVRHLRRAYADPVSGQPMQLIRREDEGIVGVHSPADRPPLMRRGFALRYKEFEKAERIADWQFLFQPSGQAKN